MAEHYTLKLIQNLSDELRRPLDGTHRIKVKMGQSENIIFLIYFFL